jgi:Transcriptional regulator AcaB
MDRREAERCMTLGARALRRAMGAALGYKYEGVKCQDVHEGNAKAQKARERMGEVPPEVLDGRQRARHAPERRPITKPPSGTATFMGPGSLIGRSGVPK